MKFKLFGTEIYISFLFAAVITILLATDRTGLIMPSIFAIIMHELGHLFAMWILGCGPKRIRLIPSSVQITSSFSRKYKNDIIIAISGPIVNFVLFFTFLINYKAYSNESVLYFCIINLIIALFNSLPIFGLDGGTVLFIILAKRYNPNKAAVILKFITLIVAVFVLLIAVTLTINHRINISLYIMAIYFLIGALIKM